MGPYLHDEPIAKYLPVTCFQILMNIRLESPLFTVCMVNLLPNNSMTKIHGLIHGEDSPVHNPGNSLSREKQAVTMAQPFPKKIRA